MFLNVIVRFGYTTYLFFRLNLILMFRNIISTKLANLTTTNHLLFHTLPVTFLWAFYYASDFKIGFVIKIYQLLIKIQKFFST